MASIIKQVFLDLAKVQGPARFVSMTITKDSDITSTFMWASASPGSSRHVRVYIEQLSRSSACCSSGDAVPLCSSRSAWPSHSFGEQVQCYELLVIQVLMEEEWIEMEEEGNREAQLHLLMFAVALTIRFPGASRGEEIPKFDLGTTREHLEESMLHPRHPHVTITLKGRVKGEAQTRCHLLPVVMKNRSLV